MNKDDSVTDNEPNYAHVLERVAKTETSVAALENDMRTVMAGVSDIRGMLMESQKAKDPNYGLIVGGVFTLLAALGSTLVGVVEYVDLTLEPMRQEMAERQEPIDQFWMFKNEMHYEMGRIHEWKEDTGQELDDVFLRLREQEKRVWGISEQ